ncbi:hypothetical protein BDZ45DRAFT_771425, partial [Acephala macrosclerotiorum]
MDFKVDEIDGPGYGIVADDTMIHYKEAPIYREGVGFGTSNRSERVTSSGDKGKGVGFGMPSESIHR